jgi:hypothetical protein
MNMITPSQLIEAVLSLAAVQALITIWMKARLESGLKHYYDRKLEEIKHEYTKALEDQKHETALRDRCALMAELIAEWTPSDRKRLNRLTFEASLWLPPDLVKELTRTFTGQANAKSPLDLLIEVRKHIRGKDDGLVSDNLVSFP